MRLTPADCDEVLLYLNEHAGPNVAFQSLPSVLPIVRDICAEVREHADVWGLPVDDFDCQLGVYGVGAYFPRHTDWDPSRGHHWRALTCAASVLLTDPDTYTGGGLILYGWPGPSRSLGEVVCFPGDVEHEVTPVTSGVRVSLTVFGVYAGTYADARRQGFPRRLNGR